MNCVWGGNTHICNQLSSHDLTPPCFLIIRFFIKTWTDMWFVGLDMGLDLELICLGLALPYLVLRLAGLFCHLEFGGWSWRDWFILFWSCRSWLVMQWLLWTLNTVCWAAALDSQCVLVTDEVCVTEVWEVDRSAKWKRLLVCNHCRERWINKVDEWKRHVSCSAQFNLVFHSYGGQRVIYKSEMIIQTETRVFPVLAQQSLMFQPGVNLKQIKKVWMIKEKIL